MPDAPRSPPRYVPTLTEVVPSSPIVPDLDLDLAAQPDVPLPEASGSIQAHVIRQVMERVDALIEQRLIDAVSALVQEHFKALEPRLREEIETVVRQAVSDAVVEELALGGASDL
ncbi:MAG: hypothetical protein OJF60_002308 [Burkholderiaceae bacterium]|jgi:predicted transcriptional regulator|nr:MAG: hypothetical protein OJF60_002308 [Burkholderiaceae bacterium]